MHIGTSSRRKHKRPVPSSMMDRTGTDDDDGYDDIDFHVAYRRPSLIPCGVHCDHDELSDYVTVRLALARAKALARYRTTHG